jgi:RNA polymerase sigma-70 factor (ECF subfamily)
MAISYQPDPDSDARIVARLRAGDERALEALVRAHYNELCVFAARMTGQRSTAEELVQEVFLRIWRRREQLALTGSIVSYLYASARNGALNELGRERRRQRWYDRVKHGIDAPLGGSAPEADEGTRASELELAIERAIASLPPRCREAYLLRRQHGMSHAEIGRVMQTTPKTVEVQIGKALRVLRKRLADWL